jgi:hypothetical protein
MAGRKMTFNKSPQGVSDSAKQQNKLVSFWNITEKIQ